MFEPRRCRSTRETCALTRTRYSMRECAGWTTSHGHPGNDREIGGGRGMVERRLQKRRLGLPLRQSRTFDVSELLLLGTSDTEYGDANANREEETHTLKQVCEKALLSHSALPFCLGGRETKG